MECADEMHAEEQARHHHSTTLSDHHRDRKSLFLSFDMNEPFAGVALAVVKVLVDASDVPVYNAKRYATAQASKLLIQSVRVMLMSCS